MRSDGRRPRLVGAPRWERVPCGRAIVAAEDLQEREARARHAAFHGADGATCPHRRFFVGESLRANQRDRLALRGRQARIGATEIPHLQPRFLTARCTVVFASRVGSELGEAPPAGLAALLVEVGVPEDGRQPGFEIGAGLELSGMA